MRNISDTSVSVFSCFSYKIRICKALINSPILSIYIERFADLNIKMSVKSFELLFTITVNGLPSSEKKLTCQNRNKKLYLVLTAQNFPGEFQKGLKPSNEYVFYTLLCSTAKMSLQINPRYVIYNIVDKEFNTIKVIII